MDSSPEKKYVVMTVSEGDHWPQFHMMGTIKEIVLYLSKLTRNEHDLADVIEYYTEQIKDFEYNM